MCGRRLRRLSPGWLPARARLARARGRAFLFAALALLLAGGCRSASPYASFRSWAVRQSETPPYAADYDLLYFYPQLRDWHADAGATNVVATTQARLAAFGLADETRDYRQPRVFAPYVGPGTAAEDVREAIRFYLDTYHEEGRLYAIVAEGANAAVARAVVEDEVGWCGALDAEDGFVASFFAPDGGLLDTAELSAFLRRVVRSVRLGRVWRRKVPVDVAGVSERTLEAWRERGE